VANGVKTMNRDPLALAYLRSESRQLSGDYELLRREFETLVNAPFDRVANATCRRKLRELRGLLANHRLALTWMQSPPCGVTVGWPRQFCPILVPPTDFRVMAGAVEAE